MGESRTEELLTSDDPLLPPCELGQNRIEFSRWSTYTVLQREKPRDSPPGGAAIDRGEG